MAKERTRLKLNLDELFPGDSLEIGGQVVVIKPLGIRQLTEISRKLDGFGTMLSQNGVTWDNYNEPQNITKIATLLLQHAPEVLEEASNIDKEDLLDLTPDIITEILDKVLEVNLASKEKLEKNFKSLAAKMNLAGIFTDNKVQD
jgi:NTP pyrophosphatase (non-canonical NTP hydrolase)